MPRPHDLPTKDDYEHGTRSKYVTGCRCTDCRKANSEVVKARTKAATEASIELAGPRNSDRCIGVDGEPCPNDTKLYKNNPCNHCGPCRGKLVWNGLVPSKKAIDHLSWLSKMGVGRHQVSKLTDVSGHTIWEMLRDPAKKIRKKTQDLILSVDKDDAADGAYIDAAPTWKLIRELVRKHGFTQYQIAEKLGYRNHAIQLGRKRITVRNADRVRNLYDDAIGASTQRGRP